MSHPPPSPQEGPPLTDATMRLEEGTVTLEGADVVTKHTHLELPGVISLGRGIRLLSAEGYPPAPGQADAVAPEVPYRQ
jgi:hypothetical protein